MRQIVIARLLLATLFALTTPSLGWSAPAKPRGFDHVYVIVLENHSFDDALFGPSPFLRKMAQTQGLATYYFGIAHPSLPNYLAMIAGDDFGVRDNRPSCFSTDLAKDAPCHAPVGEVIADQLEARGLTWALYAEDLPAAGSLIIESPKGENRALYAQKHNPFAYFRQIATVEARKSRMKPFADFQRDIATSAPNLAFIVPNQCNDGHGLESCADGSALAKQFDQSVETTVEMIRTSKSWTDRSAIIITFDEGLPPRGVSGSPVSIGCCGTDGGHHIATIVITKCGVPKKSAKALDHYSLLATIEDGFGLPRLRKAAKAETLWDLFPSRCK